MSRHSLQNLLRSIAHLGAALFNNSRDFHRAWKACRPDAPPPPDIQGRWQGEWISDANGHRGQLKAVVAKLNTGEFLANFRAEYARVLRVCYAVRLTGRQDQGRTLLAGEADLGRLAGGTYEYVGEATQVEFHCQYRCKYDHGTFRMKRLD